MNTEERFSDIVAIFVATVGIVGFIFVFLTAIALATIILHVGITMVVRLADILGFVW